MTNVLRGKTTAASNAGSFASHNRSNPEVTLATDDDLTRAREIAAQFSGSETSQLFERMLARIEHDGVARQRIIDALGAEQPAAEPENPSSTLSNDSEPWGDDKYRYSATKGKYIPIADMAPKYRQNVMDKMLRDGTGHAIARAFPDIAATDEEFVRRSAHFRALEAANARELGHTTTWGTGYEFFGVPLNDFDGLRGLSATQRCWAQVRLEHNAAAIAATIRNGNPAFERQTDVELTRNTRLYRVLTGEDE